MILCLHRSNSLSDNPYLSPQTEPITESKDVEKRPVLFRFAVIPASISFLLSCFFLVAFINWIVETVVGDDTLVHTSTELSIVNTIMLIAMLTCSVLNFLAGKKWLARRYLLAFAFNLLTFAVLSLAVAICRMVFLSPP